MAMKQSFAGGAATAGFEFAEPPSALPHRRQAYRDEDEK
jgi:hypothetical protein